MALSDTPEELRVLPPSDKGKWGRALARFSEALPASFMLGATIGGLGMAALMMTVLPMLVGPTLLGAVASYTVYAGGAALLGGAFTSSVLGGIRADRSLKNDFYNQHERDNVSNERPISLTPIVDPEQPVRDTARFEARLAAERAAPTPGTVRR